MSKRKYLIIGNGVAGTTAAHEIHKNDPEGKITIVTNEEIAFYSRIMLPEYLAGNAQKSDLIIKQNQWYTDNSIDLKTGVTINNIDHKLKQATDQTGNIYKFDALLMAQGSSPFIPPVKGNSLDNIFTLRTYKNASDIANACKKAKNAVIIGGGLLGLEAGHALIQSGIDVIVVEFFNRLLPRQMDNAGATVLKEMLENVGFQFRLDAKTKSIQGDKIVSGVLLESGETINADLVLFSAGVRSNLQLASQLGLETDMGIVVDAGMQTGIDGIFAAGDVAQFDKTNFCIWPEAQEQGRVAGINMAGKKEKFKTIIPSNRLKVAGIDLASAGNIDPDNLLENETKQDDKIYQKLVKKDNKLVGCIMLGSTSGFNDIVKTIQ